MKREYRIENVKSDLEYPFLKNVINIYEMDYKYDPTEKKSIYSDGMLFYFVDQTQGRKVTLLYSY